MSSNNTLVAIVIVIAIVIYFSIIPQDSERPPSARNSELEVIYGN